MKVYIFVLVLVVILLVIPPSSFCQKTFTAAVYEHALFSGKADNRAEALKIISRNLHVFIQQVTEARSKVWLNIIKCSVRQNSLRNFYVYVCLYV